MTYKLRPLEEYSTPQKNLFVWISDCYAWKFLTAKIDKDKQKDDFDLSLLVNNMLKTSTDTMEKVIDVVKEASNNGITGVKNSYTTLESFYNHVEKDKNIESIKEIDQQYIENFILSVNHAESNATKERYYTHLKALFNFIQEHNTIKGTDKPFMFNIGKSKDGRVKKILHTRKEKKLPVFLETVEMQTLNKTMVKNPNYKDDADKATQILIMRLFMFGLVSISELQHIKYVDFATVDDMSILELKVSDRVIPLPRRKLIEYINTLNKSKKCDDSEYFFCMSKSLNYVNNQTIGNIIKSQFEYAKIKKSQATADVLRNSGAIYLNRRGISDKKLQTLRGDKTIESIQILLKSANTDHYSTASMFDDLVK